jgi:hypothetical protein
MAGHSVRVCGEERKDGAGPCVVGNTGARDVGAQNRMGEFRRAPREKSDGSGGAGFRVTQRGGGEQRTLCVREVSLPETCLLRLSVLCSDGRQAQGVDARGR